MGDRKAHKLAYKQSKIATLRNIWDRNPAVFSLWRTTLSLLAKRRSFTSFPSSVFVSTLPKRSQKRTKDSFWPVRCSKIPCTSAGTSHGQPRICHPCCSAKKLKTKIRFNTARVYNHEQKIFTRILQKQQFNLR